MADNGKVFMKDWNLKYKSRAFAQCLIGFQKLNYLRLPVFHKYNVGGCRFFSQPSIQRAKSQTKCQFTQVVAEPI